MLKQFDTGRSTDRLLRASHSLQALLLARRNAQGWWEGHLSTSPLSTATATFALMQAVRRLPDGDQSRQFLSTARRGLDWLIQHQNQDGGWGDTLLSLSNISTTMLVHATLHLELQANVCGAEQTRLLEVVERAKAFIADAGGVPALIARYGQDRTFSVPILTQCAL
ncbi:MAG: squalene--hopene cyclase, partial [Planctomycetaceae bacterium]|nr:squalene--hopene cyclase [Planctomycetaceae bacterium]